jgi:hypothetical protein
MVASALIFHSLRFFLILCKTMTFVNLYRKVVSLVFLRKG